MLKKLFRIAFTIVGALLGYGVFQLGRYIFKLPDISKRINISLSGVWQIVVAAVCVIIFGFIFFKMAPLFNRKSKKMTETIERDLQGVSGSDIIMGTVGLVTGLVLAFLISSVYGNIKIDFVNIILTVITYLILGYLGVVIATKKGKDLFTAIGTQRKTSERVRRKHSKDSVPKILDTSVIIDGRIADLMKTGFIEGPIVIPEFVLFELQYISDSSDALKRNRGRRGLDILDKIREDYGIDIYDTKGEKAIEEIPEVDIKLLKLAQIMNGKVVTNDFNLNKVASVKGVQVLNINELANALKPIVLPGENMRLFLVKEGKENNQAVAYLDDGTMIVIEDGKRFIGKTIDVTVTSVLQTAAGRMIFAKPNRQKART